MVVCPSCRAPNPEEANLCAECEQSLSPTDSLRPKRREISSSEDPFELPEPRPTHNRLLPLGLLVLALVGGGTGYVLTRGGGAVATNADAPRQARPATTKRVQFTSEQVASSMAFQIADRMSVATPEAAIQAAMASFKSYGCQARILRAWVPRKDSFRKVFNRETAKRKDDLEKQFDAIAHVEITVAFNAQMNIDGKPVAVQSAAVLAGVTCNE